MDPPSTFRVNECIICFDGLYSDKCSVLLDARGARICQHVFHSRCISSVREPRCPVCRQQYARAVVLPQIMDDPQGWFAAVDIDGDGVLSKKEVYEVLHAQFPLAVSEAVWDEHWETFDVDGSGFVEYDELFEPTKGVIAFVLKNFSTDRSNLTPPDIKRDKRVWFLFFDDDGGGTLCKEEVCRALIKTFKLSSSPNKVREIKDILDNVFFLFDPDGSGEIDIDEFCLNGGLADTVIASLGV